MNKKIDKRYFFEFILKQLLVYRSQVLDFLSAENDILCKSKTEFLQKLFEDNGDTINISKSSISKFTKGDYNLPKSVYDWLGNVNSNSRLNKLCNNVRTYLKK